MEKDNNQQIPTLDCLICLDLLCEPVTTPCGHSFCRYCLITFIKTTAKCPVCRKMLVVNKEMLVKNYLLTELARSKDPINYDSRKKLHSALLNEAIDNENQEEQLFPCIILKDLFIIPYSSMQVRLLLDNINMVNTLNMSYHGSKLLIILDKPFELNSQTSLISSLVEIESFEKKKINPNDVEDDREEGFLILKGLSRFVVTKFELIKEDDSNKMIQICFGNNMNDLLIVPNEYIKEGDIDLQTEEIKRELKDEITVKFEFIKTFLLSVLNSIPISTRQAVLKKYSFPKFISSREAIFLKTQSEKEFVNYYESLVCHIIWMLKLDNKEKYLAYKSTNLYRKVDNIYNILKRLEEINSNSVGLEVFDLDLGDSTINTKFLMVIIFVFILLVIGVKTGKIRTY